MKTALYLILASLFLISCGSRSGNGTLTAAPGEEQNGIKTGIKIGERAPELVFESPAGENIALSSLRGKMVLIDFWAAWCGPCRLVAPIVDELAQEYAGQVKVAKLDVDSSQRTAMKFGVRSIPSILFFKDGQHVDTVIGAVPKRALEQKLKQHLD